MIEPVKPTNSTPFSLRIHKCTCDVERPETFVEVPLLDGTTDMPVATFPVLCGCAATQEFEIETSIPSVRKLNVARLYSCWVQRDADAARILFMWMTGCDIEDEDFLLLRSKMPITGGTGLQCPLGLIYEILREDLIRIACASTRYYETGIDEVSRSLLEALEAAIKLASPDVIAAVADRGGNWQECLLDIVKEGIYLLLRSVGLGLHTITDDKLFAAAFEREWKSLMLYRTPQFGFLVRPRFEFGDIHRYLSLPLKYKERVTCLTLSGFLIHLLRFQPDHTHANPVRSMTQTAYQTFMINDMYAPLMKSISEKAYKNFGLKPSQLREFQDLRSEVEKAFSQFLASYELYEPGREDPLNVGFFGMLEEAEQFNQCAEKAGSDLRAEKEAPVPFAHYIHEKMTYWLRTSYPALRKSFQTGNTNIVPGPNGERYLSIEGASQAYGISVDALRRMDRGGSFKALRARDVFAGNSCPVSPSMRLYEDSPEWAALAEKAWGRARTKSSALRDGEFNEKNAAIKLGITLKTLRKLRISGLVQPQRRGHVWAYDEECLQKVVLLVAGDQENVTVNRERLL